MRAVGGRLPLPCAAVLSLAHAMRLLAFETATEACSVALWIDGALTGRHEVAPRRHAELALPWAEALLADAGVARSQLDAIAVGCGPGAFTGVRLAVSLAQGIALALDRPVVPVSTLAVLAMRGRSVGADDRATATATVPVTDDVAPHAKAAAVAAAGWILAAIDARMGEVYVGAFRTDAGLVVAASRETVLAPTAVRPPDDVPAGVCWTGVGTGFAASDGALRVHLGARLRSVDADALPHAADVARLAVAAFARGEALDAGQLQPAYLRDNVARTSAEQRADRAAR